MSSTPGKRILRSYTVEEKDRGLLELALCGGNYRLAAKRLEDAGHSMPAETIRSWRDSMPERYEQLREQRGREIEDRIVQEARERALQASAIEEIALEATAAQIASGQSKDPARALQALTTSKAINITKVLELTGRPTHVVEHRDYRQVLQKYGGAVIEGEAVELPTPPELPGR